MRLLHQELTQSIIDCFFRSYNRLEYGFSEAVYGAALERELQQAGQSVRREVQVPVFYDQTILTRFRLDMVVDNLIVVEVKAGETLAKAHERQVFNYLRATELEVGLVFHYGPRPSLKRYVCTNDRKAGWDLRRGSVSGFRIPSSNQEPTDGDTGG